MLLAILLCVGSCRHLEATIVLVVGITSEGSTVRYTLHGKPRTLDEISAVLQRLRDGGGTGPVIVRVDARSTFETVFKVSLVLIAAGVPRITIALPDVDDGETATTKSIEIAAENVIVQSLPSFQKEMDRFRRAQIEEVERARRKQLDAIVEKLRSVTSPPPK